jgi:hypothetical protein
MSENVAQAAAPSEFADRPITGADLRGLIVLHGDYVQPSAAALDDLARAVSVLRGRVRVGTDAHLTPAQLLNDQRKKRASEALAMLASVLPGLRENILAAPDVGAPEISELMRLRDLSQIDMLQNTVKEAWEYDWLTPHQELSAQVVGADWAVQYSEAFAVPSPEPVHRAREVRELHKWHHFATFLADKFRDVVKASNPGLPRLKNGNGEATNPVIGFLVAVIPHITGEQPKPDAVRKWLQRNPAGDKPI